VRFLNQFKGRSGRQGDPGETFVVLSAESDLLGPDMKGMLDNIYKGEPREMSWEWKENTVFWNILRSAL